jgi:hypothetical protein
LRRHLFYGLQRIVQTTVRRRKAAYTDLLNGDLRLATAAELEEGRFSSFDTKYMNRLRAEAALAYDPNRTGYDVTDGVAYDPAYVMPVQYQCNTNVRNWARMLLVRTNLKSLYSSAASWS